MDKPTLLFRSIKVIGEKGFDVDCIESCLNGEVESCNGYSWSIARDKDVEDMGFVKFID